MAAIPLAADRHPQKVITTSIVANGAINNIIDFGEGVSFLGRPSGYFYANGEIIRYDGVEYVISGAQELLPLPMTTKTTLALPFNGKIYPQVVCVSGQNLTTTRVESGSQERSKSTAEHSLEQNDLAQARS